MGENLNSGGERADSQCEGSGSRMEEMTANKGQKRPREDDPSAGITTEPFAAGQGEGDSSTSKKVAPPNLVKCDICLCEMSSDLVLNSHINGSRHKKRMKALEIVANLKAAGEKGVDFKPDNGSNNYRCGICSLTVNSPQQLEIHLAGAKHKNRMAKEKLLNIVINVTPTNNQAESFSNADGPPMKKRKKDSKFLYCDVCNIMLNSETQYEQHALSKKHLGRAKGENNRKKRASRLENKTNLVQNFPGVNRLNACKELDKDNSHDCPPQHFQSNVNRIHQVHSPQNNRNNMDFSNMSRGGMSGGSPLGSCFQSPRAFMNNHRNFGNGFGRIAETGKSSKARPHLFSSHTDSVLQATSSKS